jgi:UDP-GlcNAc:undecaprenyl-phosphate/decaprenyl-phosphate GlcNAc-1-phosphate transferase
MLTWWHYLVSFFVALAATALLVPVVRAFAIRRGIVDEPGGRRVNKTAVPRMGGVAMFFGVLVAVAVEYICDAAGVWTGPIVAGGVFNGQLVGVLAGLACVTLVGVADDVRSLPPWVKFAGQVAAACIIAFTGTLLSNFKLPFTNTVVGLGMWAYPITIVYLVAFANIINLIDGLDGLAAGITGISALSLFVLTVGLMRNDAALVAIILVGICVGFLFYNFNPASIFMGDSGSLLIGMMLGVVSLLGATRFSSITALAVPIVIAGVPVIDTFSAIIRRVRGHQRIDQPDAGHIHHRLLRRGFTQRKAVLVIYAWTAVLCVGATLLWNTEGALKYGLLLALLVASALIIHYLGLFGPVLQHTKADAPRTGGGAGAGADAARGDAGAARGKAGAGGETGGEAGAGAGRAAAGGGGTGAEEAGAGPHGAHAR